MRMLSWLKPPAGNTPEEARAAVARHVAFHAAWSIHATQGLAFAAIGYMPLVWVNLVATSIYLFCLWLFHQDQVRIGVWLGLGELLIHVPLATYLVGFEAGYGLFYFLSPAAVPLVLERKYMLERRLGPAMVAANAIVFVLVMHDIEPLHRLSEGQYLGFALFHVAGTLAALVATGLIFANKTAETEAELERTNMQLAHADKMASLGLLVAGVAHEINTPVGAIKSTQQTIAAALKRIDKIRDKSPELKDHPKLDRTLEIVKDGADVLESAAARVERIVTRLRNFARLDQAEVQRADLHAGIDETIDILAHQTEKQGITIERNYGELPKVLCYASSINQLVMNLVNNARQAVGENGVITVETFVEGKNAHIVVQDDGEGIAPENLGKLFQPGFTTRGVGVGTGLGLAICWRIAERHDGTLTVSSEPGEGARFELSIPIDGPAEASSSFDNYAEKDAR
jgi:signal transduction histidine kinase